MNGVSFHGVGFKRFVLDIPPVMSVQRVKVQIGETLGMPIESFKLRRTSAYLEDYEEIGNGESYEVKFMGVGGGGVRKTIQKTKKKAGQNAEDSNESETDSKAKNDILLIESKIVMGMESLKSTKNKSFLEYLQKLKAMFDKDDGFTSFLSKLPKEVLIDAMTASTKVNDRRKATVANTLMTEPMQEFNKSFEEMTTMKRLATQVVECAPTLFVMKCKFLAV
jgi:hypothetical protein